MSLPSVFVFPFEGRKVCYYLGGLREVKESKFDEGLSVNYSVIVNGTSVSIAPSNSPLLKLSEDAGEIDRLISFLLTHVKALEDTVATLEANESIQLEGGDKNQETCTILKDLRASQARVLRLEALVDYQRRELDALKSASTSQAPASPTVLPIPKEAHVESERKKTAALPALQQKLSPRPVEKKPEPSQEKKPEEHEEGWELMHTTAEEPSSSGISSLQAKAYAKVEKERKKIEEEAAKKAEKERKKTEERKREEERKKQKEMEKRAKEEAKHSHHAASASSSSSSSKPKSKTEEIIEEFSGVVSGWKPGKDKKADARVFFASMLGGKFEKQLWIYQTCGMNNSTTFQLDNFVDLDDSILDLRRRWAPQVVKAFKYSITSSIMRVLDQPAGVEAEEEVVSPLAVPSARSIRFLHDNQASANIFAIHLAARYGQLDFVKWCLDNGASVNESDNYHAKVAHHAAMGGHVHILTYIAPKGAAMGSWDSLHKTVAHYAAIGGQLATLQWIKEESIALNEVDSQRFTPALYAAALGHMDLVKWFITDSGVENLATASTWPNVRHLIHFVALHRDVEIIQWLSKQKGFSLGVVDEGKFNLSHYAAVTDNFDLLRWLHETNACEFNSSNYQKLSVFHLSCATGNMEMINWISKTTSVKVDAEADKKLNAAHIAAKFGCMEVLQWLYEQKCPMTQKTEVGMTILHYAARRGNLEMFKWIASNFVPQSILYRQQHPEGETATSTTSSSATLSYKDKQAKTGQGIMHMAAFGGHITILEFLQSEDVDIRRFDDLGGSLAHYAAKGQSTKTLQWLFDRSLIDFSAKDSSNCLPANYAATDNTRRWFKNHQPAQSR